MLHHRKVEKRLIETNHIIWWSFLHNPYSFKKEKFVSISSIITGVLSDDIEWNNNTAAVIQINYPGPKTDV